jgi:hypothetical protein
MASTEKEMREQIERIREHVEGEVPPPVSLCLDFKSEVASRTVLERVRRVMELVAVAQAGVWPNDSEWSERLPGWFLASFAVHTKAEIFSDPRLWDYGSWLDAMRQPRWEWWSGRADDHCGRVRCVAIGLPYSIEPMIYLIRAAGASEVEFAEG